MPVSLLGAERLARYGRYANDPSREQLARFGDADRYATPSVNSARPDRPNDPFSFHSYQRPGYAPSPRGSGTRRPPRSS